LNVCDAAQELISLKVRPAPTIALPRRRPIPVPVA
jgi:hypothetical protein